MWTAFPTTITKASRESRSTLLSRNSITERKPGTRRGGSCPVSPGRGSCVRLGPGKRGALGKRPRVLCPDSVLGRLGRLKGGNRPGDRRTGRKHRHLYISTVLTYEGDTLSPPRPPLGTPPAPRHPLSQECFSDKPTKGAWLPHTPRPCPTKTRIRMEKNHQKHLLTYR